MQHCKMCVFGNRTQVPPTVYLLLPFLFYSTFVILISSLDILIWNHSYQSCNSRSMLSLSLSPSLVYYGFLGLKLPTASGEKVRVLALIKWASLNTATGMLISHSTAAWFHHCLLIRSIKCMPLQTAMMGFGFLWWRNTSSLRLPILFKQAAHKSGGPLTYMF